MELGYILTAANKFVNTSTFGTPVVATKARSVLHALPLGDTVGDGTGTIGVKVLTLGPAAGVNLYTGAANGLVSAFTANVGGTTTLAARATRRTVVIAAKVTSPETIYYGFTTGVTAANGQPLNAGQSISLDYKGALFFFSTAGTGTLNTTEIYD